MCIKFNYYTSTVDFYPVEQTIDVVDVYVEGVKVDSLTGLTPHEASLLQTMLDALGKEYKEL